MKLTEEEKNILHKIQSKGGKMNVKKHGKKHMGEIGKKGAEKRWANHKKNGEQSTNS